MAPWAAPHITSDGVKDLALKTKDLTTEIDQGETKDLTFKTKDCKTCPR